MDTFGPRENIGKQRVESHFPHPEQHGSEKSIDGLRDYVPDETDRQLDAVGEWFSRKLRGAKLVDLAGIVTNMILVTVGFIAAYIYNGQLAEMRHTNELTEKALDGSDRSIARTLIKMQDQIDEMHALAVNAGTQAKQTTKLAAETHALAAEAGIQAAATQSLSIAAQDSAATAKDAVYEEQRPWVGIEVVPAALPSNFIKTSPGINASTVVILAHNTGRTPALRWRSECCEVVTQQFDTAVPDYDAMTGDPTRSRSPTSRELMRSSPAEAARILQFERERQSREKAYFAETSEVIPPNGTRDLNITTVNGPEPTFHYSVGKMVYWDVISPKIEHVTKFCLVSFSNGPIRLCRSGQDMN